jgi:natural resistance-associated macrophage protein
MAFYFNHHIPQETLDLIEYDSQETKPSNQSNIPFMEELEIKPEVDTGAVSDEWFSFKKLWKYTGPGN